MSITGKAGSTLDKQSDATLLLEINGSLPAQSRPTSSSTAMLVMGDALAMVLLESRGFTEEDFSKFHPGGSLGTALLTRVSDIMRSGDSLAIIKPHRHCAESSSQMSQARSGACIITHDDGSMAGIFTHGDFARLIRKSRHRKSACQPFMTKDPVTFIAIHSPLKRSPPSARTALMTSSSWTMTKNPSGYSTPRTSPDSNLSDDIMNDTFVFSSQLSLVPSFSCGRTRPVQSPSDEHPCRRQSRPQAGELSSKQ